MTYSRNNPYATEAEKTDDKQSVPTEQRLRLLFGQDAAKPPLHDDTVVEGLLHTGAITLMYGKPKSGKSFLATNLALAVADEACARWMEHKIKKTGVVLYIACEGHGGFWKRLQAAGPVPDNFVLALGRPRLVVSPDGKGYNWIPDSNDIRRAVDDVKKACDGNAPVLVVIDTVFRSIGGADANKSADMNAYISAVQEVADMGIAVLLVHHANKGNGLPSGSVVLMAAADTIALVERPDRDNPSLRTWEIEEAKDGAETPPREFELFVVHDIENAEGDWLSSCRVIDKGGYTPPSAEDKKAARAKEKEAREEAARKERGEKVTNLEEVREARRTMKEMAEAAARKTRDEKTAAKEQERRAEQAAKEAARNRITPKTELVWNAIVGLYGKGATVPRQIVAGQPPMASVTRGQLRDHLKAAGLIVLDDKGNIVATDRVWLQRAMTELRDRGDLFVLDNMLALRNGAVTPA